ncbi:MAG: DUF3540 domain-containing protein [Deltaproteobacteria bacterium]|jgi:hypothetical protein|nr:DUF3540 domain-containing protein [Deltaproteobacteria bacterium]
MNLAFLPKLEQQPQLYLGPATVTDVAKHQVKVARPDGSNVPARLALAFSYEPHIDDEVLLIGTDDGHYVVGVLRGSGTARLTFPGDVELRSLNGNVRIAAAQSVDLEAPRMALSAGKLQLVASSVRQRCRTIFQSVTELLSVQAGKSHTVVDGVAHTQAGSANLLCKDRIHVNGKSINLG